MAKLHFKYGAMNSGKSDTLIKTAFNYEEQGLEIATIKPRKDSKGGDMIVARGGYERQADILADAELDVRQAIAAEKLGKTALQCVLVDEAQFLEPEQVSQLYEVAKHDDTSVIAFGLLKDFKTHMFAGTQRLVELADNLEKLPTMCRCGSQAEFNVLRIDGDYVFEFEDESDSEDENNVLIDGEDGVEYDSMCGGCYMQAGGTI